MSSLLTRVLPALLVCAAGVVGCNTPGNTMQVKTNSGVVSNVARYRTYSHANAALAPAGYSSTAYTPEVLDKVRARVDFEMEKRGYTLVPAGDLVVRISSGVRTKVDEPTASANAAGAPLKRETIGGLAIDIFDRENEGHLFHGFARDEINAKSLTDQQISAAVETILEPLPSRLPPQS
jgi:hypothetical protein